MKTRDYLIVALAPFAVLLIPLVGTIVSEKWQWTPFDFVAAWVVLAGATFIFRLLVTRPRSNLAYKLGAGIAVATGLLVTWINLAVQIIGDENPAFLLYFVALLTGLVGVGISGFRARGMANAAFATAAALFFVPVIAVILWPNDFSPGAVPVFFLNGIFVLMFVIAGLLFRHAAGPRAGASAATAFT